MKCSEEVTIVNQLGLHARAATKLAQLCKQFHAKIELVQEDKTADASSVLALLMLVNFLDKVVIGQREAVSSLCKALRRSRADLKDPRRPIGTFALLALTEPADPAPTVAKSVHVAPRSADALIQKHLVQQPLLQYNHQQ